MRLIAVAKVDYVSVLCRFMEAYTVLAHIRGKQKVMKLEMETPAEYSWWVEQEMDEIKVTDAFSVACYNHTSVSAIAATTVPPAPPTQLPPKLCLLLKLL